MNKQTGNNWLCGSCGRFYYMQLYLTHFTKLNIQSILILTAPITQVCAVQSASQLTDDARIWQIWNIFSRATFWSTALSSESTFICSILRLALRATPSALALPRTWAISSFALRKWGSGGEGRRRRRWLSESALNPSGFIQTRLMTLTCPVSPQHEPWGFGTVAPPAWSSSGSPVHTSSAPPHSVEMHVEYIVSWLLHEGGMNCIMKCKAVLTFLKPSRTPFKDSYLLKRSAKERSTELRSARAWSLSKVSCLTDLLQDSVFCCCSSSTDTDVSGERF